MLTEQRHQQVIEYCQSLVRQKSYSGHEAGVVDEIRRIMEHFQFDDIHVDDFGNIIGGIVGNQPGEVLLLDGHIDTVPVDESQWSQAPWGAEIRDGKIYGRGTSDMKGAVAAMIAAVGFFAQDCQRNFRGAIYVACVVHEECFEGVAARAISARYHPDSVIIGEASELNINVGQRGRAEIVFETFGKPAHSANPHKGINAVYHMSKLINRLSALAAPEHARLGPGILEITDIKSSPYPGASVVPDYCRATADRRLLVGETEESVLAPLRELIDTLSAEDPQFRAQVSYARGQETCYTGNTIDGKRFFPGWITDTRHPLVEAALTALTHNGRQPKVATYSFCTNGSHYAGEAGIATIGFGPSRENLAHVIDEYIEIEQLTRAADGYYAIIRQLHAN
ncbi:YgeY family selenium metabolism-linked hydrolase [Brenneria goodwinii]|uniref:YgeY family selenium metabolism-linked hydrolase n=1 Tax=Brenneria goodwinii TaxID=1109412 RepID=UPI0036E16DC5